MADPRTLSDFIRWGVETCPAKKYVLVLWGHGNGAGSGLFIDELFDGDYVPHGMQATVQNLRNRRS